MTVSPRDRYALLSLALVLFVFAVDLSLPLGVASAVPYTFAVLLGLKARRKWFGLAVALLCIFLTVAKMGLVPDRGTTELWKVIANRCLAGFSIGVTTFLGMRRRRAETERLTAEEQIRQHLADLAHLGRVNTAGQIAIGLAHELNQPLAAVCLQAEVAAQFAPDPSPEARSEVTKALQEIADQSHRAAEIIRALRRLVRRADPAQDPVDMNDVVRAVVRLTDWHTKRVDVEILLELAEELPLVIGDRVQLEQVVFNLFQNAVDAVVARVNPSHRAVRVETEHRDGSVFVRVRDTGEGLPTGEVNRVFDRFYTTKANGTGMGLAISRSIVEAHRGRIWAENGLVDGAVFTLTIPMAPEE